MNAGSNLERLEAKIFSDRQALAEKLLKYPDQKTVFTNGCFDILHKGHVSYLSRARDLGEILVVGLNSDLSVKKLKGPGRPVQTWLDRAFVLSGLFVVDYVVKFEEDTPIETLQLLRPDIHCKGGDYTPEALPEKSTVDAYGGRIEILSFVDGYSTSNLLQK